ncbi:hypothetical protein KCU86_g67, partial [Aureobasidium melanogenum]
MSQLSASILLTFICTASFSELDPTEVPPLRAKDSMLNVSKMNLTHPRIFLAPGCPQRAHKLVKPSHLEKAKVVTRFPQSLLDVEIHHTLGSGGEPSLTIVGRNSLCTSVGVVVSEVFMVVHEGEADGCQSTLEHGLRGGGSTQVVDATVESEATVSIVSSVDTTLNQSNQIGLTKVQEKVRTSNADEKTRETYSFQIFLESTLLKPCSRNQAETHEASLSDVGIGFSAEGRAILE